jgi:D-glycero-alpha-D-manno-heptose-7-phosphate kinase
MITVRAPYRLPLGGGGTDLPWFARDHGGLIVAAALDLYVHVMVRQPAIPDLNTVTDALTSAAIEAAGMSSPMSIAAVGDVPGGTGLGSSGAYLVALLQALDLTTGRGRTPGQIAELACAVEEHCTGLPAGKQDPYMAAFGGFQSLEIARDGTVTARPLAVTVATTQALQDRLVMVYTGVARSSTGVLAAQQRAAAGGDSAEVVGLQETKDIGRQIEQALIDGDLDAFGQLLDQHWQVKRRRSATTNSAIDEQYELAKSLGARGGKLIGAGGGGFLLLDCGDRGASRMRQALSHAGMTVIPVGFASSGAGMIPAPVRDA